MIAIHSKAGFPAKLLERAAKAALQHQSAPAGAHLTIVLTDDERIRELNRDYLGIDAPTDVLSFPASETDPETGSPYLGDILISLPYAAKSAARAGHPLDAEVQLLVVHGVLHLLGHDHAKAREKARMWKAQAEILESLGLGGIEIRED
ncbi:MAG: rRNA maturation RNase YbeY [Anaerolineales bacterium]